MTILIDKNEFSMMPTQLKTPLLNGGSISEKRAELKAYFQNSWLTYESLFALINQDDAYFLRPEPLRHPLIFYFGHTAVFYINKLLLGKFIDQRVNQKLEAICAVGVDEMSWDDLHSDHYDWPTVTEVRAYRQQVYHQLNALIDTMPLVLPISQESLAWIILMGCEHERIHLETSSVLMRMLPLDYLTAQPAWQACISTGNAPPNQLLPIAGKRQRLGKKADDETYGWDNEFGELSVTVDAFHASQYLVSNQEFLAFVEAGGYQKPVYWSTEGRDWLAYTKANMPAFWFKQNGRYYQRNLLQQIELPMNWPVEVNYLEANAFCHWLAEQRDQYIRLPTEAEWYCLRDLLPEDLVSWTEAPGNINLAYFASSCPVNRFACQDFYDIIGNVWQWTESAIDGFSGFKVHPLYDDFSTPTFDGRHNLIKGGSWISTGNEAIKSSRYAFRRHFVQHAGFRYIASDTSLVPDTEVNRYETDPLICQQLHCHYAEQDLTIWPAQHGYFPQLTQLVQRLIKAHALNTKKLLDLGCSVGRLSFELAPLYDEVDAIDVSARFIQHAVRLQQAKNVRYQLTSEGELVNLHEIGLAQIHLNSAGKILFSQGDASNLKAKFTGYDMVIAQQVLERHYHPEQLLRDLLHRVNSKGLLMLISDYQFEQTITAKDKWLGGFKQNGENVTAYDRLSELLKPYFVLLEQSEVNQIIRLTQRSIRQNQLQITVWQKITEQLHNQ